MCNLQTYLFPKSSWHCFLVLCSLLLLFVACTTTEESDQNGDQLARRMTGGQDIPYKTYKTSFFARVYTFSITKGKGKQKSVHEVVRACAGTFISHDLVLTALQCVLLIEGNYQTVVQLVDFGKPLVGINEKNVVNVLHFHQSPQSTEHSSDKNRLPKELVYSHDSIYDVVLLQTDHFQDTPTRFAPLYPCHEKGSQSNKLKLRMMGITKKKDIFTGSIQDAPLSEMANAKESRSHRIVAFSDQGAKMDSSMDLGSPAFLQDPTFNTPECLYGLLSGYIFDQPLETKVPKIAEDFTVLDLEPVSYYLEWLEEHIKESDKRWETIEKMKKSASERERQEMNSRTYSHH